MEPNIREKMLADPDTHHVTVNGVDVVVNKEHHYVGCINTDVPMPKFIAVVLYLRKEGFLDEE